MPEASRGGNDGFLRDAAHSITHTVPRGSLRQRLVPWTLAVVITLAVATAGAGFILAAYWLMWSAIGLAVALAAFGAASHAWRYSTRYKRPLDRPTGPLPRDRR